MFPGSLAPNAACANGRKRGLPREKSRDAEDSAIQQNLTQFEVDPVPYEQDFEGPEAGDEGEDAGGEETRGSGEDVAPLR